MSWCRYVSYNVTWLLRLPYPLRNVLRRWRSLVGMMAGMGIALGTGMTMLAVSNATTEIFTGDYRVSGTDLYVATQGGKLIAILPGDSPGTIKHARNVLAQIRALPGVRTALGIMNWQLEREREGPKRRDEPRELLAVVGVDGDPTLVPNLLALQAGRWLRRSDEIVLGPRLSREKQLGLGAIVRLDGKDFTVVGIGKLRGFSFAADALAYLDYRALRQRADFGDVVNVIAVDADQPAMVRQRISEMDSLAAFSAQDLIRDAEEVHATAVTIRWVFIILTLLIAGLFVSNMMGRSVAERRLEFATLRAIGIPRRTILLTVGGEATLVSIVAWLVGVLLSAVLGAALNGLVAPTYQLDTLYVADAGLFLFTFGLALLLGLVSGFAPARQAVSVDPIVVLREA